MSKVGVCAWCCICFILPFAIMIVLAFCTDLPSAPKCYIQEFYVPALDMSLESTTNGSRIERVINPSLFLDLALRNGMSNYYVLHSDIKLTFSYGQKQIASYVIPSFFQDEKDTTYRRQVVETQGVPWGEALKAVSNESTVIFRVDLVARPTMLYFDEQSSYKKHKDMKIGANVEVDGSGMKVQNGYIRLTNSAASVHGAGVSLLSLLLLSLSVSYSI